ncbi:unnamed protein product [Angiostrongylus costaricensis]|uniref:Secreted protein n=1 Tax=Angiostrongylus costaricensis TaxID=334426 RepID=A0A0R3PQ18_ANGCS|nr:unnamed protein product [Angiostrongylus costaricensis]
MVFWVLTLLVFCVLLFSLYNLSQWFHYINRISFLYICIFLHAIECCITLIPSRLSGNICIYLVFHTFKYWTLWTGVNVEVRGFDEHLARLEGPAIISVMDVVAMTRVWPSRGTVMMKKSFKYVLFFNLSSILANAVFVDRFNHSRAMNALNRCRRTNLLKFLVLPINRRDVCRFRVVFRPSRLFFSNYRPFSSKSDRYFKSDGEVIAQVLRLVNTKEVSI